MKKAFLFLSFVTTMALAGACSPDAREATATPASSINGAESSAERTLLAPGTHEAPAAERTLLADPTAEAAAGAICRTPRPFCCEPIGGGRCLNLAHCRKDQLTCP